jgi:precorrin-6A/cobalt-precorrin-6A reductase
VILVLGGTGEARALAGALHASGVAVTSSLAGRVSAPRLPAGEVRIGGFGGPRGLARWLVDRDVRGVVDATHPFAERISASAGAACAETGVPLLRLLRPGWTERPGDRWTWVDDLAGAAHQVAGRDARVLLTTGRGGLASFASVEDAWFLVRCVEPPDPPVPPRSTVILDRGPYTLEGELAVIDEHGIDLVVTKDSGGELTVAKLDAARERGLEVIVVRRPAEPGGATVPDVEQALSWVAQLG